MCVRLRTVRQETTKFKAGTLPLNMYEQKYIPTEKFLWPRSEEDEELDPREPKDATQYFEQQSEYDTDSSVDELDIDEVNDMQLEDEETSMAPRMAATELKFLFTNSRSRSARLVMTSSKALNISEMLCNFGKVLPAKKHYIVLHYMSMKLCT